MIVERYLKNLKIIDYFLKTTIVGDNKNLKVEILEEK